MTQLNKKNKITKVFLIIALLIVVGWFYWRSTRGRSRLRDDDYSTERSFGEHGDYDCSDFSSWREAQSFFENEGGPSEDYHNLDRDGDGIACEALKN